MCRGGTRTGRQRDNGSPPPAGGVESELEGRGAQLPLALKGALRAVSSHLRGTGAQPQSGGTKASSPALGNRGTGRRNSPEPTVPRYFQLTAESEHSLDIRQNVSLDPHENPDSC